MKTITRITMTIFGLVFFMNSYLTPMMGDDYAHFQLSRGTGSLIENMFINLKTMYWTWCGRMLVHFFDGLILACQSRFIFSLVNLACLFFILNFIHRSIAAQQVALRSLVWILGAFLIAFGIKSHFQVLYLTTGAANYFWSFGIIASYLYYFSFLFRKGARAPQFSNWKIFGLCLLGFLTGSTNENVGICLVAVFLLSQIESFLKKEPLFPRWVWLTQAFVAVSAVILISAPGNYARLDVIYPNGLPPVGERLSWWFESLAVFLGRPDPLLFIFTLAGAAFYIDRGSVRKFSHLFVEYRNFLLLAFLMIFVFLGNDGNFYGRKGVHSFLIFGFFCILIFAKSLDLNTINGTKLKNVGIFIAILTLGKMGFDLYHVLDVHDIYARREAQIQLDNKKPDRPIVTCSIDTIFSLEDLNEKSNEGLNNLYARYIGVGPIVSNYQPCKVFLSAK